MEKIYKLNQKLEKLESQKQKFNSFEDISILQFMNYKNIVLKKNKITKQMQKIVSLGEKVNFWYDTKNQSWIENPKINHRKYYKLEQNIAYKKNLKLYKLGLSNQKPIHPTLQNIHNKFQPVLNYFKIFLDKINFSKKILAKIKYFSSNIFPQKINQLAITTLKPCIKGYKIIQSDIKYVTSQIQSKPLYKYFKQLANEANNQLIATEKNISFKESLKVNSQNLVSNNNSIKIQNNHYNNIELYR